MDDTTLGPSWVEFEGRPLARMEPELLQILNAYFSLSRSGEVRGWDE